MFSRTFFAAALVAISLCAACQPARAQRSHNLTIRDGQVFVDGRQVPSGQLPASLELDGIDAEYIFSGDLRPVIERGGFLYTLDGTGIREVGPVVKTMERTPRRAGATSALPASAFDVMRPLQETPMSIYTMRIDGDGGLSEFQELHGVRVKTPEVVFMRRQAHELARQADGLQQLRDRLGQEGDVLYTREIDRHALRLREQAAESAMMAQELPLIEARGYLADIQRHDRALFERLVTEREMEEESVRLAVEINLLPAGAEREARIDALRLKLHQIFELKQENRRREVVQLERQLTDLQARLAERERLRDQIIEARLQELLERHRP